jgi:ATP-dependent Clp protease ATP-binding subunit ClpC
MEDKFNFNLRKTAIYQAVKLIDNLFFKLIKLLKITFLILSFLLFIFICYSFLINSLNEKNLFLFVVSFDLFLIFWLGHCFLNSKIKKPFLKIPLDLAENNLTEINLADFLSFEAAQAVSRAIKYCWKNKTAEISSSHVLFFLINDNKNFNFIFSRALLNVKQIKQLIKDYFKTLKQQPSQEKIKLSFSQDFQEAVLESFKKAAQKNHSRIQASDLLIGLACHDFIFKQVLINSDLKSEDIDYLADWLNFLEEKQADNKKFWLWKNLIKKGSLAKEWAAGYTVNLDQFSIDLSDQVKKAGFPRIIGHEKETQSIERILSRKEINNVLIVGEPGKGRKSMVHCLAAKSVLGESLPQVNYKRIVQLDLPTLLAQITSTEQVEIVLDNIFKETINAGNIILMINDFDNFIGKQAQPGTIDISGIIAPYLNYPSFQIIAITSFEGLHKNIEQNSAVLSLFEKVEVSEINEKETLMILENLTLEFEYKYKRFVSYPALRDVISYCSKYLTTKFFPEKAISLLDEAMAYLSQTKDKVLLPKHISSLVSEKIEIPVGQIEEKEKQALLNLEKLMHQRIINQEKAVQEICSSLRRARTEVATKSGPIGTFLFLGPTGVGKTETAKALAEIYFGSEKKTTRLDMSEFQNINDIARLIGSAGQEGLLTTEVRENPFSLILLDEIEKAHPNVLNLFLQVLDEGHLTDGLGRKVDFKNSIIIATSNAGSQIILKAIEQKTEWLELKDVILDFLFQENVFKPEFINRFDSVVVFKPLTKENLLLIAQLMIKKTADKLKEKEIELIITEKLKEKIVDLSYDPSFGAREMKRVIQDKIENALAQAVLSDQITKGDKIELDSETFQIIKK